MSETDQEEPFDVVDESDRPVGRLPRSEVHARGLRHRAVSVLIHRSDGCLLVQRRTMSKDEFPGRWSPSASGHVSAGESYDLTAARELEEEVGLSTVLRHLHTFDADARTANEFMALYEGRTDAIPTPDPAEVSELRWMAPDALAQWMAETPDDFTPSFLRVFGWWRDD